MQNFVSQSFCYYADINTPYYFSAYGIPTLYIFIFATSCNSSHISWNFLRFIRPKQFVFFFYSVKWFFTSVSMIIQINCYQYHKVAYNIKNIRLSVFFEFLSEF